MIAKGLDYPGVRLVGVINADTAINLPDFRATERTFQLVSQVAGRAGRSDRPGLVIVQTFQPRTPAIALAAAHDYESFARRELEERARLDLPPLSRRTRIVIRDADLAEAVRRGRALAEGLERLAVPHVTIRGPAPCPIARIAARHRQQIELISRSAGPIQTLLAAARSAGLVRAAADMAIDVDPISML
jgi:primosomal protein N' (replication factor Y)